MDKPTGQKAWIADKSLGTEAAHQSSQPYSQCSNEPQCQGYFYLVSRIISI